MYGKARLAGWLKKQPLKKCSSFGRSASVVDVYGEQTAPPWCSSAKTMMVVRGGALCVLVLGDPVRVRGIRSAVAAKDNEQNTR